MFPLNVVPKTVVPTNVGTVTVPVKVAPDKFAFVFNCELINVILAGVANKVETSEAPE